MKSLYWKIRIAIFALRRMWGIHLGDNVWYQGKLWTVTQGVSCPLWTLRRDGEAVEVHQDNFQKQRTPLNYWQTFLRLYGFYMLNWHSIWVREGLQDWMRCALK